MKNRPLLVCILLTLHGSGNSEPSPQGMDGMNPMGGMNQGQGMNQMGGMNQGQGMNQMGGMNQGQGTNQGQGMSQMGGMGGMPMGPMGGSPPANNPTNEDDNDQENTRPKHKRRHKKKHKKSHKSKLSQKDVGMSGGGGGFGFLGNGNNFGGILGNVMKGFGGGLPWQLNNFNLDNLSCNELGPMNLFGILSGLDFTKGLFTLIYTFLFATGAFANMVCQAVADNSLLPLAQQTVMIMAALVIWLNNATSMYPGIGMTPDGSCNNSLNYSADQIRTCYQLATGQVKATISTLSQACSSMNQVTSERFMKTLIAQLQNDYYPSSGFYGFNQYASSYPGYSYRYQYPFMGR